MKEKKIYASENFEEEIKKIIENEFGKLNSNKVILLEKNLKHIEERHPEVIEILKNNFSDIIKNPDYSNTIWLSKKDKNYKINTVIKLTVKDIKEHKDYLNSIITSHNIKARRFEKYLSKHIILYKKEK